MGAVYPFVAKEAKIEFFDSRKKAAGRWCWGKRCGGLAQQAAEGVHFKNPKQTAHLI